MERRQFISAATTLAAAGTATPMAGATSSAGSSDGEPGKPVSRRMVEQRWLLDQTIAANGIDWDQPRSIYLSAPCGPEAGPDFAAIRARVKKMADIAPAFEGTARRREARATAAEQSGDMVTARDNYFMAAIHWGAAQWPYDENDAPNRAANARKRDCYGAYARLADHRVEAAWIPFQGKALPAWFHLPPDYRGGRVPVVVAIPGMDSMKESAVSLYGDRFLNRGMAVLAIDGPGQYESPLLGIRVSQANWVEASKAIADWLVARTDIDPERMAISGTSFGSLFTTWVAANEPRFRAAAVSATCLEPGCHTIFEEASPTFKQRFMYMAGIPEEARFDTFRKELTWQGHAERIRMPYLVVAGEADELSPMEYTEACVRAVPGPKQLVVYQESRHSVGGVPSANLGPAPAILVADWVAQRLTGKAFASERHYIDNTGRVTRTPL